MRTDEILEMARSLPMSCPDAVGDYGTHSSALISVGGRLDKLLSDASVVSDRGQLDIVATKKYIGMQVLILASLCHLLAIELDECISLGKGELS